MPSTCLNLTVFGFALIAGTGTSLISKALYQMQGTDRYGNLVYFERPLFQTMLMFMAMMLAAPVQWAYKTFYDNKQMVEGPDGKLVRAPKTNLNKKMVLMLIIPACSDVVATAIAYVGLKYVEASVFQLLKAAIIVFVAFERRFVLHDSLTNYQWVGVWTCLIATLCVGAAGSAGASEGTVGAAVAPGMALYGVGLVLLSCFVQSLQYVLEERFMTEDVGAAAPLEIVAAEGTWGFLITAFVVFPLARLVPGDDDGCIETFGGSWDIMKSSDDILYLSIFYFLAILMFNTLAVLVTFLMDSVWHAVLDSFRPLSVWGFSLCLYYFFTAGTMGEALNKWAPLQLAGMMVLFLGTAIYSGSVRVPGMSYDVEPSAASLASPLLSPMRTGRRSAEASPRAGAPAQFSRLRNSSYDANDTEAYGASYGSTGKGKKSSL